MTLALTHEITAQSGVLDCRARRGGADSCQVVKSRPQSTIYQSTRHFAPHWYGFEIESVWQCMVQLPGVAPACLTPG